ncbi:MAG: HD domain-containing protein [Thermodesulfobacteriota bacterium]|nr:HD domain-containing protein [Thermodesulfobacteriota bacterium]
MDKIFIEDIRENDRLEAIFLVKEKHMAVSKNGKPYLNLKLGDRTGEMSARVWDNAEYFSSLFEKDDFIKVKSRTSRYQNDLQLVLFDLEKCSVDQVFIDEFLPKTDKNIERMFRDLVEICNGVKNSYLRELLHLFFEDEEFTRQFKIAPAAKGLHHVYIGGLLEHSFCVAKLILDVVKHYNKINADLLLTGGILHDIGKIHELSYERSFDYTDEGRLLGHITIGVEMIEDKIVEIADFPSELAMLLKHLILSHHGHYEFGSPKRPKTIEALILYYLDDMDAKIRGFQQFIEKEKHKSSKWTSYHKLFERYIYKDTALEDTVEENWSNFNSSHSDQNQNGR